MQQCISVMWFLISSCLVLISPHLNGELRAQSFLTLKIAISVSCDNQSLPVGAPNWPLVAYKASAAFFFFFNRVSNVLDDSAVNCGLTLHLSGFISCVFGSGILSPAIVVIETICVSSESPLNPWLLSGLGMCV